MPKQEKIERVAELKERIEGSGALLLTEYRGLTVSEITELRRSLAEGGTRFQVIKNTLMKRAVNDAGVGELEAMIEGPSAVAFVDGDPVAAAKSVVDAAKKFPALSLKGGFMDGKVLSADEAKALASLESREVMLSKIAGLVKSEMSSRYSAPAKSLMPSQDPPKATFMIALLAVCVRCASQICRCTSTPLFSLNQFWK